MANPLSVCADWSYHPGLDFTSHTLTRDSYSNNLIGTTKVVNLLITFNNFIIKKRNQLKFRHYFIPNVPSAFQKRISAKPYLFFQLEICEVFSNLKHNDPIAFDSLQ